MCAISAGHAVYTVDAPHAFYSSAAFCVGLIVFLLSVFGAYPFFFSLPPTSLSPPLQHPLSTGVEIEENLVATFRQRVAAKGLQSKVQRPWP